MQKFIDRRARVWIVDIDNTTLRRVKTITGIRLLDAVDGDLVTRLSNDPLLLGDVLYAICKPQADQQEISDEAFGEGLAGDVIADATNALLEALLAYFPEGRRRLLRKAAEKQKLIETRGMTWIEQRLDDPALIDKVLADLERRTSGADLEQLVYRLAGIIGVDPGPLTLRQLVWMADGANANTTGTSPAASWHCKRKSIAIAADAESHSSPMILIRTSSSGASL